MFLELFGAHLEGDAVGSTKRLCTHVLLQNAVRMTKVIQKLGHHASTLCLAGERNSGHGFFELR